MAMVEVPDADASRRRLSAAAPSADRIRPASSTSRPARPVAVDARPARALVLTSLTTRTITALCHNGVMACHRRITMTDTWTLLIALHASGATLAVVLGGLQLLRRRRGDLLHR